MTTTSETQTQVENPSSAAPAAADKYTPEQRAGIKVLEQLEAKQARQRDEAGRFVGTETVVSDPAAKEQPKAQDAQREEAGDKKTKGEPDADYDAAVTKLKRLGVPESALKATTRDEALKWAEAAWKSKTSADGLATKLAEYEKAKPKEAPIQSGQPSDGNLRSRAQKLAEMLVLDDAGRQEIESALYEAGKAASDEAKEAYDIARSLARTLIRSQLEVDFPELKAADPERFAAVLSRMERTQADFENFADDPIECYRACFKDAVEREFQDEIVARKQAAAIKKEKARDSGQPSVTDKPRAIKPEYRGMNRALLTLQLMEVEGMTADQARRVADEVGAK